jgi:hypothetical protein
MASDIKWESLRTICRDDIIISEILPKFEHSNYEGRKEGKLIPVGYTLLASSDWGGYINKYDFQNFERP